MSEHCHIARKCILSSNIAELCVTGSSPSFPREIFESPLQRKNNQVNIIIIVVVCRTHLVVFRIYSHLCARDYWWGSGHHSGIKPDQQHARQAPSAHCAIASALKLPHLKAK